MLICMQYILKNIFMKKKDDIDLKLLLQMKKKIYIKLSIKRLIIFEKVSFSQILNQKTSFNYLYIISHLKYLK